ncbi:mechanosensitive ion channel family protein [Candidatus Paracaedibacter symbiosus]|uniref:mechanosensitive ion channel family protein n=1 Tax=Candidatus Paracaedibacter symbiosus TaxID=244582 RepID=UPI0005094A6F|nr:mechanosensitive ion channel domain-containing protein [Candidatus Paracaedibacter symbiosus]
MLTVLVAFAVGAAVENIIRRMMAKFKFYRPKTYTLYNFPQHIFRNSLPVILFGISAYSVLFYYPIASGDALDTSFMWVTAIVMIRTSFMVLRILFASRHMRATEKNRQSYISSYQFALAIAQILVTGIIFAELGVILGAGDQIYQVWLKILSFGVTSLLILAIWKIRFWGIAKFEFEDENCSNLAMMGIKLVQLLGNYWHWFISFALVLSFFLYFIGMTTHSLFVASATALTVFITAITLWLRNALKKLHSWLERKVAEEDSRLFLSLSAQPRMALINFLQFLLHTIYIILLFQTWGADPFGLIANKTVHPYLASAISIVLIVAIIRLLWIWTNYIATSHIQAKVINGRKIEPSLFAKTITPILQSVGHWVLAITAIILILEEVGIPIMPIIYGISVIGIAISLGAQSLVKDLINGILTLMEGNIAVGEVVVIGPHTGTVESLSLRGVSLRHSTGALQTIPFSEVSNIINKSRDYTSITIELPFPYETEMSKVREVLQAAYNDTIADPFFQRMVIDPVSIAGIDRFTDAGFVITGSIRIKPDPKNRFVRAFNQKLKTYLETEKITPPSSAQTVIINNTKAEVTPAEK